MDIISHDELFRLRSRAYALRVLSLEATTAAGSGHPTSCLSAADIVAALFFHTMHYNPVNPDDPTNDRFILSKGHAAPVLYAAWEQVGVISKEELLSYRSLNSILEGHPTPRFPYIDVATGSLGCGLSNGLGMALSARLGSHQEQYTYVLLGDSEVAEGSVWEAAELASFYKVDTLIAIVDLNRLGQTTETLDDHDIAKHAARWCAFGWETFTIDGHDMLSIVKALDAARAVKGKPSVIIACTQKGYGLSCCADKGGYHGKAFSKEELPKLLQELKTRFKEESTLLFEEPHLTITPREKKNVHYALPPSSYKQGMVLATRKAFGQALAAAGGVVPELVSLDAEVKNSTFAEIFEKAFPKRFFQCFVAEQNMFGMAAGFAARHYIPFSSTFASFLTRAHDQIRMAAISMLPLRIAGSHAGISIGQDGPSQMGLEDIALIRGLPHSIVLYPCDAPSTHALIGLMINYHEGISYIRLTRSETPVLYEPSDTFVIGGSRVLKESDQDSVCIIAAGITVFEALKAYDALKEQGIAVSVIDAYSVKPLDEETLVRQASKAHKRVITVEDHYREGGLGEAVCYALRNKGCSIEVLAVERLPRSGTPQDLLEHYRIDKTAIIETVFSMIAPHQTE